MNLASLVAGHPPGARALYADGTWHTWGDVRRRSAATSEGLVRMGVGRGDRVAISWHTSAEFVFAYLGTLASGAVAVPLNPNSPAGELAHQLEVVGASVLLSGSASAQAARELREHDSLAGGRFGRSPFQVVAPRACEVPGDAPAWEDLSAAGSDGAGSSPERFEAVERSDDELAALLFTSGTAGAPRAARLSHGNLASNLRQMLAVPDILQSDDVGLAAVPLFHVFGLNVALGLVLATGASLVLEERFDPEGSLELVRRLGVSTLVGVPAMFAAWSDLTDDVVRSEGGAASGEDDPGRGASALPSVRRAISGADALPAEVAQRFERRFGIELWQGYGLTEASPAVATSLGTGRNRAGSVGRPLPGVEVRIVDESGARVLDGDPGEIWVRGENVFGGYWDDDEATSMVLAEGGWLRTGDVGILGEDGDLYVVDRLKDIVIVSGFNVYPAEVENVLSEAPGVAGVVVVGRPDPVTGESIEAAVVRAPGSLITEQELRDRCSERLARYKCPSSIRFVRELPTGLAGKALRRAVREGPG